MYDLYKEYCDNNERHPVKISYNRHIFNTQYNLGFHAPHKDTCDVETRYVMNTRLR